MENQEFTFPVAMRKWIYITFTRGHGARIRNCFFSKALIYTCINIQKFREPKSTSSNTYSQLVQNIRDNLRQTQMAMEDLEPQIALPFI